MSKSDDRESGGPQGQNAPPPSSSRLGPGMIFKGEIAGAGDLVVEGRIQGKITLGDSDLLVGRDAQVEADIVADNVDVNGSVTGDIQAAGRISIASEARVSGDLSAAKIAIRDGAQYKGSIRINKPST